MRRRSPALLVLAVLAGCAGPATARIDSDGWAMRRVSAGDGHRDVAWTTGAPGAEWSAEQGKTSDFAWTHRSQAATLYADSSCGPSVEDVPLTVLINHQMMGFEELSTRSQVELEVAQRGALQREVDARIDGRPVRVLVTVVRKGPCIFDLVYVHAQREAFDGLRPAYDALLAGVRVREEAR